MRAEPEYGESRGGSGAGVSLCIQGVTDAGGSERSYVKEAFTEAGFAQFFHRYELRVRRFFLDRHALREDAEDMCQEAFLVLWRKRQDVEPLMARAYLFGIAKLLLLAHRRVTSRVKTLSLEEQPSLELRCRSVVWGMREDQSHLSSPAGPTRLQVALGMLPWRQRQVMELVYCRGLSRRDAARVLGIAESTLRVHHQRALGGLKRGAEGWSAGSERGSVAGGGGGEEPPGLPSEEVVVSVGA